MTSNLDKLMAHIRAEAKRRWDDWLQQLIPEGNPQQSGMHAMRTRRSRPPTRLSPSPPTRRQRAISSSPQVPAPANGRTGQRRAAVGRDREPADEPPSATARIPARSNGEASDQQASWDIGESRAAPVWPCSQASNAGQERRGGARVRLGGTPTGEADGTQGLRSPHASAGGGTEQRGQWEVQQGADPAYSGRSTRGAEGPPGNLCATENAAKCGRTEGGGALLHVMHQGPPPL
ncbi:hypothetical protein XELAEV_18013205mg [Xenopus laevis]|uniref:Uncharacterized protein n=1 Tax=Xenopus laevis TaxID=8355 RepID=A0A974DNY6_XENLA|nr:hypothetical protein XELAEV_18013205mg [Xenopus laevis]